MSELELGDSLERFRAVRRDLEASVLPLASSVDGRRFSFQASLHDLQLRHGGYVALGDDRLGQVLSLEMGERGGADLVLPGVQTEVTIRHARGEGVVVEGDGAPFHDALIRPAVPEEVGAWLDRTRPARAQLHVGELALAPGVPCAVDAGGFDRHTFLCGQSGSGKTYSLGVILERLLMETSLRVVILDPNSDFVRLGHVRESSDGAVLARYREVAAGVRVPEPRLRLAQLEPVAQAALLRLDPVADREEYAELAAAVVANEFDLDSDRPLATRARNLGADKLGVWARDAPTTVLDDVLDAGARCVVVDLGSLATHEERSLVAGAVLGALWERREQREPVLIVIDEAHNVCPARAGGRADRAGRRAHGADRGRGAQVRALPAGLDPASAEGAGERDLAVRQPRADAAQLGGRHRLRAGRLLVRPGEPGRPRDHVHARRGARRRQDLPAAGADPLRRPDRPGGRRRRARDLGCYSRSACISARRGAPASLTTFLMTAANGTARIAPTTPRSEPAINTATIVVNGDSSTACL